MIDIRSLIGQTDIYLLDQVLRGNIEEGLRILDVGCGGGRNLRFFLSSGFQVGGCDPDRMMIERTRALAAELRPDLPAENFRMETAEESSFESASADVVICSAVLHFARSHNHFERMLHGAWRLLRPGGLFFCRLASTIGMESERFRPLGDGRFVVPDGSERYLVDQRRLLDLTEQLGGTLVDPLKTTVVQDLRCMTTWVLRRTSGR